MDQITITTLRCSPCNHRFQLTNMDQLKEFRCPKCKALHVKHKGSWFDAKYARVRWPHKFKNVQA